MDVRSTLRLAVAVLAALLVTFPSVPALGANAPGPWLRPVGGLVLRPFVPPITRFGPGHRGVDLVAPAGTPVYAANSGVVAFAGQVGGTLHVVVSHIGELRTSYSFLSAIAVRRGESVERGSVVGNTGGASDEHGPDALHFGLRVGERYVDPMKLFAAPDLSRMIRLAPVDSPQQTGLASRSLEQRSLAASLHLPQVTTPEGNANSETAWDRTSGALAWLVTGPTKLVGPAERFGNSLLRATPLGGAATDARSISRRLMSWARSRKACTTDLAAGPSGGGSGHVLLAIGGINSQMSDPTAATFGLDWSTLGFRPDEVRWFSYAPDHGVYRPRNTWGDLFGQALSLRSQLRAMQRESPGREVDLVAHSQGGVVVDAFLQLIYDPADPTLPPIGNVVTLSSPHRGVPIATVVRMLSADPAGRQALRSIIDASNGQLPPANSPALRQLAESSPFLRAIWDRRMPEQIDLTTIGSTDDVIVPADHSTVPGVPEVTVNPRGLNDHSAIASDPLAMAAVRLALEQKPLPCVGLLDGIRGAIEPVIVSRFERGAGKFAHHVSRLVRVIR